VPTVSNTDPTAPSQRQRRLRLGPDLVFCVLMTFPSILMAVPAAAANA
jgi:hypothetical protein